MNSSVTPCPCGGFGQAAQAIGYNECCKPLHNGIAWAKTAEQLMRSRYSAFVQQRADYLEKTLLADKREAHTRDEINRSFANIQWQSLAILEAPPEQQTSAEVEFVAFYLSEKTGQAVQQLHERSRFCFEQGQWFYVDGDQLPAVKLGRNDPCWCGSGKKLKKCHA